MSDEDLPSDAPEAKDKDESLDIERAKAKITKSNNEARSLRERVKELEAAKAELDELKAAGKSDAEKLTERITAAEQRALAAEARAARMEVAAAKGLTAAQARRLVGTTVDELEADAEDLLATFRPAEPERAPAFRPARRPVEALRGGVDPTDEPEETDPAKLAALIPRI